MRVDLEILARELKHMAEQGTIPDGKLISVATILWAEGWLLSLAELGIMPAFESPVAA
jgi:hypothetical protein